MNMNKYQKMMDISRQYASIKEDVRLEIESYLEEIVRNTAVTLSGHVKIELSPYSWEDKAQATVKYTIGEEGLGKDDIK